MLATMVVPMKRVPRGGLSGCRWGKDLRKVPHVPVTKALATQSTLRLERGRTSAITHSRAPGKDEKTTTSSHTGTTTTANNDDQRRHEKQTNMGETIRHVCEHDIPYFLCYHPLRRAMHRTRPQPAMHLHRTTRHQPHDAKEASAPAADPGEAAFLSDRHYKPNMILRMGHGHTSHVQGLETYRRVVTALQYLLWMRYQVPQLCRRWASFVARRVAWMGAGEAESAAHAHVAPVLRVTHRRQRMDGSLHVRWQCVLATVVPRKADDGRGAKERQAVGEEDRLLCEGVFVYHFDPLHPTDGRVQQHVIEQLSPQPPKWIYNSLSLYAAWIDGTPRSWSTTTSSTDRSQAARPGRV